MTAISRNDPRRAAAVRGGRLSAAALALALAAGPGVSGARAAGPMLSERGLAAVVGPDALWRIVHDLCVPDQRTLNTPAPCADVDLAGGEEGGYAVLKDIRGKTQFLLIPTRRLAGMEDPLVGAAALPNYWRAAWTARSFVAKNAGRDLPRADIGLAVNGPGARSQNQLHIHIDCVRLDVRAALAARIAEIGERWSNFALLGRVYRARRIAGAELVPDPFRLLAEDGESAPLRDNSLAVFGVNLPGGGPGFALLAERAPAGRAHLENLLDHKCAAADERLTAE